MPTPATAPSRIIVMIAPVVEPITDAERAAPPESARSAASGVRRCRGPARSTAGLEQRLDRLPQGLRAEHPLEALQRVQAPELRLELLGREPDPPCADAATRHDHDRDQAERSEHAGQATGRPSAEHLQRGGRGRAPGCSAGRPRSSAWRNRSVSAADASGQERRDHQQRQPGADARASCANWPSRARLLAPPRCGLLGLSSPAIVTASASDDRRSSWRRRPGR